MLLIVMLVLLLAFPLGGNYYNGGAYRSGGFGLGGLVLIVLLILLFTGGVRF